LTGRLPAGRRPPLPFCISHLALTKGSGHSEIPPLRASGPSVGMTTGPPLCPGAYGGRTPEPRGARDRLGQPQGAPADARPLGAGPGRWGRQGSDRRTGRALLPSRGAWGTPRDAGEKGTGRSDRQRSAGGSGRPWGRRPPKVGPVPARAACRVGRSGDPGGHGNAPGPIADPPSRGGTVRAGNVNRPGVCRSGSVPKLLALRRRARYKRLSEPPSGVEGGDGRGRDKPPSADQRRYLQIRRSRSRLARPRADEGGSDRRVAPWS
jgi:hypothetical protein